MQKPLLFILVLLATTAVAIADVFLKKASLVGTMGAAFKSPWFWGALGLYLFQIFFFIYIFVAGMKLSAVGVLQSILYALIVLTVGILFFNETLSPTQIVGIILGIVGVILLNI